MMKLLALLSATAILVYAGEQSFNIDTGKVDVAVGDSNPVTISLLVDFIDSYIGVFGKACKDADSCTAESHVTVDATSWEKKADSIEEGKFTGDRYSQDIKFAATTGKTIISVYSGVADDDTKAKSGFPDGYLGLALDSGKGFLPFLNLVDDKKKRLFFIPKDPKGKNSSDLVVFGEENANKYCNEFGSIKVTTTNKWFFKSKISVPGYNDGKENEWNTVIIPGSNIQLSQTYFGAIFKSGNTVSADEYKKLPKITIKVDSKSFVLQPSDYTEKNGDSYKLLVDSSTKNQYEVGLGKQFMKKFCIQLFKDGSDYKVGVAERKTKSVNVIGSLGFGILLIFASLAKFL